MCWMLPMGGGFYAFKRPRLLVGSDPKYWDWIARPDIFIPQPIWMLRNFIKLLNIDFDILVCDPPEWRPGARYRRRDLYSYVIGDAQSIIKIAFELSEYAGI